MLSTPASSHLLVLDVRAFEGTRRAAREAAPPQLVLVRGALLNAELEKERARGWSEDEPGVEVKGLCEKWTVQHERIEEVCQG